MKENKLKKKELLQILYALKSIYDLETAENLFEKIILLARSNDVSLKVVPFSLQVHPEHPQISQG